jgi:hypothetical protein
MVCDALPWSWSPSISIVVMAVGVALSMSLDIVGSRSTVATSSKRVISHPHSRSDHRTGASSRSTAYCSYGDATKPASNGLNDAGSVVVLTTPGRRWATSRCR